MHDFINQPKNLSRASTGLLLLQKNSFIILIEYFNKIAFKLFLIRVTLGQSYKYILDNKLLNFYYPLTLYF